MKPPTGSWFLMMGYVLAASAAGATGEPGIAGAVNGGMGRTGVAHVNLFSALNNQGGLGYLESFQAGVFAEQRFWNLGIATYAAAVALPTSTGTFALSAATFGYALYRDVRLGLGFGRSLGPRFSVGVQVDYLGTSVAEYGSASSVVVEAGILAKVSGRVMLGAHVFNPTRASIGATDERVPSLLTVGVAYESSDKVMLTAEMEKDILHAPNFRAGLQMRITDNVIMRGGFQSTHAMITFGIGIGFSKLQVDLANAVHTYLGSSPMVSVVYAKERKR